MVLPGLMVSLAVADRVTWLWSGLRPNRIVVSA